MSTVAPHAGIIDFGEYIPAVGGQPARPGSLPAPTPEQDGFVFTTEGWTDPAAVAAKATFESVSKNLPSADFTLVRTAGKLTALVYANGVTKTLNRTGGRLTSIVLSGATPAGISLTKTLIYDGTALVDVEYS
jgi:hypothetical protein